MTASAATEATRSWEHYLRESAVPRSVIDDFIRRPNWATFDPELGYTLHDCLIPWGAGDSRAIESFRPDGAVELLYPDSPADRAAWAVARLRRQQWRITAEPSPVPPGPTAPATYVLCAEDRIIDPEWARAAVPDPVELPGDHCPFLARPAELADLLVSL